MKIENIKALFDACYTAKRTRELLPDLPKGVNSSYIHCLDAIEKLQKNKSKVKVSDIGDLLKLPLPDVTRTIKKMEKDSYLKKVGSLDDGRVTYIEITKEGKELSAKYNTQFFNELAPLLKDISDEDVTCTIRTLNNLYKVMRERGEINE